MRRFYCVLGDPVAHSRSPAIHARAFARLGLDAVFAPCRVTAAELPAAVSGLRSLGCAGFNVTVPHKTAVAGLVDRLEGDAARIAAVSWVTTPIRPAFCGHSGSTGSTLPERRWWSAPVDRLARPLSRSRVGPRQWRSSTGRRPERRSLPER